MPQQKLYIQQNEKENFQNLFSRDFNINLEKDKKYKQKLQKKRQYFSQSQRQNFLEFLFLPSNTKFRMLGHDKFHFYDMIYAFSGILYSNINLTNGRKLARYFRAKDFKNFTKLLVKLRDAKSHNAGPDVSRHTHDKNQLVTTGL